ncbi:alpha/beta fold hydrolase [Streptomyces sp. NBC_00237]|uniref:alpha/beta fold hydrolase n=1 Tax=Streptomyces sp. NBC_00237 TaxID=2975687 RepID=UPI00224E8AFA|nr:alpha/beta fold hydrolase [Streptomyces sp. NBC_00237]MCX5205968.1 alpha/beta fold hydrolase [Streptomyces sp. NBC_00237]
MHESLRRDLERADYPFDSHWYGNAGIRQHYLDEGHGEPVLMLHGNPTWSYYWRHLVSDLRDSFRCIVPDHIGMGLSDRPSPTSYPYSAVRRLEDLEKLMEHLVTEQGAPRNGWTLVLHDWGGAIGTAWARRHPDRVRRLVLLNTAGFAWPSDYRLPSYLRMIRDHPAAAAFVARTNAFARGAARWGVAEPLPQQVREAYLLPYRTPARRLAITRFIQDIPLQPSDPAWPLVAGSAEEWAVLRDLPALIGWGERDPVFTLKVLREWRRRLPQAHVHRFPRAGHYVLEDAKDDLLPAIRSFLTSPPSVAPPTADTAG